MPIVLKHEAAGITPNPENPRLKYGTTMALQQQRADQEMRQRAQDAQYDMQRMGAMGAMRQPSIGEESMMLDQEIRRGMYDPDTVKKFRDEERIMREIMNDRGIDATQRARALENMQSRIRLGRATGRVQPMQQMGPAALQTKPPMTEADYFSDEKNYANAYAAAQARLEAAGPDTPATLENIQAQMHNDYLARQKFVEGLRQPQGQGQPAAQPPNAPAAAPAGQPQASYTGGVGYGGVSPVLAQGGFQPTPIGTAPVGQSAYQPTGDYTSPEVFGAASVLANPAQPQQVQQEPQYPMESVAETKVDPGYMGKPGSDYMSNRTFRNADGRTMIGSIVGINPPAASGGFSTVQIKKESDGKVYDVPLNNLSQQDQQFVLSGGNRDTQYALQNPQMSEGQAYFDPNNPVRKEMSAADQSIVNPKKETLGKPGGRYGLRMIDYGINPATGNRVTASIRPGGGLEYDPPGLSAAEQEYDKEANAKYEKWEKDREKEGRVGSVGKLPPADNPLTKLLTTMTPSQQRDFTKWLMEDNKRYAMRYDIAQQQLNQMEAEKKSGQLPVYPGFERRTQQGQAPAQGQPMQGQMPPTAPPAAQGQSQPPKPAQQPPVKLPKDDKRVQEAIGIATNPYSTMQQLLDAASILAQSDFTEADIAQMEKEREAARTQSGSVIDTSKDQKGRTAEVIDESVPPQQPTPSPTTPAERAATAAGNVAGAVGLGASAVAQTPAELFLQPIVTGARTVYDAITGGSKYSSETAKPSQKTPATSPKAVASQPADGEDKTRAWTNIDGVPMFDGKLESISEPITRNGTQTRTVTLRDSKGNAQTFDIKLFSQEDQNFLMTQYNIGIAKNAWPEKDFLGRYGTGEPYKYDKKGDRPKKQSMNPKTSGYDENRRVPNPEYRQKGEKTPTARTSQAKRTG